MGVSKRQDRGGSWWVDFTFRHADGRKERVRRASPVDTKAGAEAYEHQLRQRLLETGTLKDTSITVSDFAEEYFRHVMATMRPRTAKCTCLDISRNAVSWMGGMDLKSVDDRTLSLMASRLTSSGLSPSSVNLSMSRVSTMLSRAKEWGYIEEVPAFRRLKVPESLPKFLTFSQADALMSCDGLSDMERAALALGMKAGLRQGEIFGLRWCDVDMSGRRLTICGQRYTDGERGPTKTGKVRIVPIPGSLMTCLKALVRGVGEAYVLDGFSALDRKRLPGRAFGMCGIDGVSGWHVLRHTYASHLVMRGAPIKVVQELLGHASISMTMVYSHLEPSSKVSAVSLLDGTDETPQKHVSSQVIDFR